MKVIRRFVLLVTITILPKVHLTLSPVPGLYSGIFWTNLDRMEIWNRTSGPHIEVSGGYNFVKQWRRPLPGVINIAVSLVNFLLNPKSILSFRTNVTNATTTSATININPIGS